MDFSLPSTYAVLERTPSTLRALLQDLPEQWTAPNEGPDTWSPFDVLGHLVHGERTNWVQRAEVILAQGESLRFKTFDRFAQFRESEGKSMNDLLGEFAELRANNLRIVKGWKLTETQLSLEGEHDTFGRVTLRQLLSTWTAHDLAHIGQVVRVMAKQYRDAVGPWRSFLSIMDR